MERFKILLNLLLSLEKECVSIQVVTLKPAKFMEDMTYDMAGSATVVGLMKTLH